MTLPQSFNEIDTPALLVDTVIIQDNILRMQEIARRRGIALRPHVKAHKCGVLARMQLDAGAVGIAIAKLSEAEKFASLGFTDIQIANQVVDVIKIRRLLDLSRKTTISVAVDSKDNVTELSEAFTARDNQLDLYIEINVGLNRCGLSDKSEIIELAKFIDKSPGVHLKGILSHAGQAYSASGRSEIETLGNYEGIYMTDIAALLRSEGLKISEVSVGSTPTAKYAGEVQGVTEIRPGNYIFNDMMQVALGNVGVSQCALTVQAMVISKTSQVRVVIDAGSKALAQDQGVHGNFILNGYGYIPVSDTSISRLSEEHGIITHNIDEFSLRDRVRIVPNHACPVMNLFDRAYLVDADEVIDEIKVDARGCMI